MIEIIFASSLGSVEWAVGMENVWNREKKLLRTTTKEVIRLMWVPMHFFHLIFILSIRVASARAIKTKWRRRVIAWTLDIQCQTRKLSVNCPIVSEKGGSMKKPLFTRKMRGNSDSEGRCFYMGKVCLSPSLSQLSIRLQLYRRSLCQECKYDRKGALWIASSQPNKCNTYTSVQRINNTSCDDLDGEMDYVIINVQVPRIVINIFEETPAWTVCSEWDHCQVIISAQSNHRQHWRSGRSCLWTESHYFLRIRIFLLLPASHDFTVQ